ncbi:hypothetical protein KBC79_01245 [Candidatus Woesebacteria bacterium]|nr:hypothetical protein [Candidatus Woesebacteria bacterium]
MTRVRELHLLDGTVIEDHAVINSMIKVFRTTRTVQEAINLLKQVRVELESLETYERQQLGALHTWVQGYQKDQHKPYTHPIFESAEIELWFGKPINREGGNIFDRLRPVWREYWFAINAGNEQIIRIAAQLPVMMSKERSLNWLPTVESQLISEKTARKSRQDLERQRNELYEQLKLDVVSRLKTLLAGHT